MKYYILCIEIYKIVPLNKTHVKSVSIGNNYTESWWKLGEKREKRKEGNIVTNAVLRIANGRT